MPNHHCCYGTCTSDSRYSDSRHDMAGVFWIKFPKPETNLEKCKLWISRCGRKTFCAENINRYVYICSKHFVGGHGPTDEHPHPVPAAMEVEWGTPNRTLVKRAKIYIPEKSRHLGDHSYSSVLTEDAVLVGDAIEETNSIGCQTDITYLHLEDFSNVQLMDRRRLKQKLLMENVQEDDKFCKFYTGPDMDDPEPSSTQMVELAKQQTAYGYFLIDSGQIKLESSEDSTAWCINPSTGQTDLGTKPDIEDSTGFTNAFAACKFNLVCDSDDCDITEKQYNCDIGGENFNQNNSLAPHCQHPLAGNKSHKCDACQKEFQYVTDLKQHLRVHTGGAPYERSVCGEDFTQNGSLADHLRVHTGEKPHKCDASQKEFQQITDLTEHHRTLTEEGPYKCDVCQKEFQQTTDLKQHRRIHTGEGPYKCGVFGEEFIQNDSLTEHLRVYTGEKPYQCDVCWKGFSHSCTKHHRLHTGEKPIYKCIVCGKEFSYVSSLLVHFRIHSGENPYMCEVCGKVFKYKYSFAKHCQEHSEIKPYKCGLCTREFYQKTDLRLHLFKH